jgi:hypothetical protein
MGSTVTAGNPLWRRAVGGFIAAIVVWIYASALSHGFWPSGHPWSGLTLSLSAVHNFLPLNSKRIASIVVAVGMVASAVLWGLSLHSASAERSRAREASAMKEPPSDGESLDEEPSAAAGAVGQAAAAALGEAARLASGCHAKAGPVGSGKVRVVYAQDGSVQSADILTKEFRDTLTGSCVRMVFRRAKIPPFSGPSRTFIKAFSISET